MMTSHLCRKFWRLFCLCWPLALTAAAATSLGNPNAPQGGTFYYNLEGEPTTLNPLSSTDGYSRKVKDFVLDQLAVRNPDTYQWEPALAESWTISPDSMEFTFKIRQGVKWHDGRPLTVEDVKFSFDVTKDPVKYKTAHLLPYYEDIEEAKIIDSSTIKFRAKSKYFGNLNVLCGLDIVPKHLFENPDEQQQKVLNRTLMGSGPYRLKTYERGKRISLEKNPDWWGLKVPYYQGIYNVQEIFMRFVQDETIAVEMLKKGQLDFANLRTEAYMKKTSGPQWGKTVFKVEAPNKYPRGYAFIGWNLKRPLFSVRNHRLALYHLVNRPEMNQKFLYDREKLATGPLELQSDYADKTVAPVAFDPHKALALLKQEGWSDTDGDQVLDKVIDGKKTPFQFTILEPLPDFVKYLTIYKEEAKKIGVDINIKVVEWSTFIKLLDEKNFDAVRLAWGGGSVEWEPKQIWHTEASRAGGSNFISYSNPKVDQLIDESRTIFDSKARVKKLQEVYRLIADDVPYVFFFNRDHSLYAQTSRMQKVKDTYIYEVGYWSWWITP